MSALNLLDADRSFQAIDRGYKPATLGETTAKAFTYVRENFNFDSEQRLIGDPLYQRNALLKERTGKDILELTGVDKEWPNPSTDGRIAQQKEANRRIDAIIAQGRNEAPETYKDIKTSSELEEAGKQVAKDAELNYQKVAQRSTSATTLMAGTAVGGLGAGLTDPVNILTLPLGAGEVKTVGTGVMAFARGLTVAAAKEGAIQAGIEAASIPQAAEWQHMLGNKYGFAEGAEQVAFGFLGGAGFRVMAEGIVPAYRGMRRGASNVSSYVMDQVASKAPKLDQTVRDAIKGMSRQAYIDEAAPAPVKTRTELKEHRAAVESTEASINRYEKPSAGLSGVTKVTTPRNDLELDVKARVVDLNDLITSDMKEFDQRFQPRDRANRAASEARINEIAARLDPAQLGDSRVSNTGSPIVGPDMMVESGNGRVMALRQVYDNHQGNADAYRQFLKEQGYDTEGMERPVLVRQRISELTEEQRRKFVTFSNEDVADRLSSTERAVADANLLDDRAMGLIQSANLENLNNRDFIRTFVEKAVSPAERNAFISPDGSLSQDGLRRLRGALLAKAYDDSSLVQKLLEDTDNNIKTIGGVLTELAPEWSRLRSQIGIGITPPRMDITKPLMEAVHTIVNARAGNKKIADMVDQHGLFAEAELSADAIALLRGMYNPDMTRALGADKVAEFLGFYLKEAGKVQNGADLLGDRPLEAIEILITGLEKLHGKEKAAAFGIDKEGSFEVSAIRAAGLDRLALDTKHPKTGMSYLRAVKEMLERPETTKLIDTPERQVLHDKIIDEFLTEPAGGYGRDRVMEIIIGPPGSGKSSVVSRSLKSDLRAIEVDSDAVKERLPEFDGGLGANAVHEESKALADIIMKAAIDGGMNIVHPLVGGNAEKMAKLIDKMTALGYTVNVRLVHIPATESLSRVINRFGEEGRAIPPSYVMGIGDGPLRTFNLLKQREDINAYSYFDNNVKFGQKPLVIESSDPRFSISANGAGEGTGSGVRPGKQARSLGADSPAGAPGQGIDPEKIDSFFEHNAYRAAEYRDRKPFADETATEVNPTEALENSRAQLQAVAKENPDMVIDLEDGRRVALADYMKGMENNDRLIEALTTCRVA